MSVATISARPPNGPALVGEFNRFIGIDWSGAEGEYPDGIAVASMSPNGSLDKIEQCDWSRKGVCEWLNEQADKRRILAGIDFAFAHPFVDKGCYYPESCVRPDSPRKLWEEIDEIAKRLRAPHLYAARPVKENRLGLGAYYHFPNCRGARYEQRLRRTESVAAGNPSSSFFGVGAKGVAAGSLAGMRFLHKIAGDELSRFAVWPFDYPQPGQSVLVEIYPALFLAGHSITSAGRVHKCGLMRQAVCELNGVLAHFKAKPLPEDYQLRGGDLDERDAIASAAALRHLSREKGMWKFPDKEREAAEKEGWIFGVKPKVDS